MAALPWLHPQSLDFPDPEQALDDPNGLLAVGGDLSPQRILNAYRHGIFPWYEEPQPILWWSPNPRSVLAPEDLHISRSLRKSLRTSPFELTADQAFDRVITACAGPRQYSEDTWISGEMADAYCQLHQLGHAHSIETWLHGDLVGGLYGVRIGGIFFGESMFSLETNASKAALCGLVWLCRQHGTALIDCQIESEHLNSMGANYMPRADFITCLGEHGDREAPFNSSLLPQNPALVVAELLA